MRLSLAGERPRDLAAVVNAVSESYLDEILTKDHNERAAASAKLKGLLDEYNDKLTRQRGPAPEARRVGRLRRQADAGDEAADRRPAARAGAIRAAQGPGRVEALAGRAGRARGETPTGGRPQARRRRGRRGGALRGSPRSTALRQQADDLTAKLARIRRLVRNESDPSVRDLRTRRENAHEGARRQAGRAAAEGREPAPRPVGRPPGRAARRAGDAGQDPGRVREGVAAGDRAGWRSRRSRSTARRSTSSG